MKFHKDGTQPAEDEIFVFGSNLAGVHGAGAAKQAMSKYGARYGVGVGFTGRCYAIPTKDLDIKTLSIEQIKSYIFHFVKNTLKYSHVKFFITRVGCGLAGLKDADVASLFKGCSKNCNFPKEWEPYL